MKANFELPTPLRLRLEARYREPHRRYHALDHVQALLRHLAEHRALAREPRSIEAAIWFHDAIYDTRRDDNEARSAALARTELGDLGWPDDAVERVAMLIDATRHHDAPGGDGDAWLFLDLDLSVLGQEPSVYAAYARGVREEYSWVDATRYHRGRGRVLQGFLDRPEIYRTPELHAAWDARARLNLAGELQALAGQTG